MDLKSEKDKIFSKKLSKKLGGISKIKTLSS